MPDPAPPPAGPQSMEAILASIKRIIEEPAQPPEPDDDVLELGTPAVSAPASPRAEPDGPLGEPGPTADLVSPAVRAASARAMAALAHVQLDPAAPPATLDGLVRELLRPMLKEWLDVHLPGVVEAAVAREVARLGPR